jgi:hypothetical protein
MSLEQIKQSILALPLAERRQLYEWFFSHVEELAGEDDQTLDPEVKAEILRRCEEMDAHPERLEPCAGTTERVRARISAAATGRR